MRVRVLAAVIVGLSVIAPGIASASTTPPAGGVTLDEAGRLVPTECAGDNAASAPDGVAEDRVDVAALAIDFRPLADIGFAATELDPTYVYATYMEGLNADGGVCGRTIDVQQVVYDVLQGQAGQACVEATEDRANLLVNTASYDQILCITNAGVPANAATDVTAAELEESNGLLFARSPLIDDQYQATVQYALESGALDGTVGVWYGNIFPGLGDAVEGVVLPALDEAGIDYVSYRTDAAGPSDPEGNAVLTAAATDFVSQQVDTVLMFVGPTNVTGMQNELHAQGLDPRYISAPVSGNTSNEIFADRFGTRAFTDGQQYITYSVGPSELDSSDPVAASCHALWTELTGETVAENTFDYQLITSVCVQVDELAAALSIAGGDLTRETIVAALDQIPAHSAPGLLGELAWTASERSGPALFSVQTYDSDTNTVETDPEFFEVE